MSTDEMLNVVNNSTICSITEFINKAPKMFPDIKEISIVQKQDMGVSGSLAWAEFNFGQDHIIVKGWLHANKLWSPDTHGYVLAKKI